MKYRASDIATHCKVLLRYVAEGSMFNKGKSTQCTFFGSLLFNFADCFSIFVLFRQGFYGLHMPFFAYHYATFPSISLHILVACTSRYLHVIALQFTHNIRI